MIGNILNRQQLPGVGVAIVAPKRELFLSAPRDDAYFPQGGAIDGNNASDPGNPVNQYLLRAGLVLGRITASNQYGASIIGPTAAALANGGTALYVSGPVATEINRRLGSSGTLNLTGANAAGVVRTVAVAYSAVATSGGNDAKIVTITTTPTAGYLTITLTLAQVLAAGGNPNQTVTTDHIAYNATAATVQAAINAVLGPTSVTVTMAGGSTIATMTSMTIAFTGQYYATISQPDPTVDISALTSATAVAITYPDYVTITAPSVNEVQTVSFAGITAGTLSAGAFGLRILDANGVWQEFAGLAAATSASSLQTLINTAMGTNAVVVAATVSSTLAGGFSLTFSGTGYAGLPQTLAQVDLAQTALVSGSTAPTVVVTRTTAGVDGTFPAGSFVQPNDGSQTPVCLLEDPWGYWIVNYPQLNRISIELPRILVGPANIRTAMIVNYPSGTALKAWLKAALRTVGSNLRFDDDLLPGTV